MDLLGVIVYPTALLSVAAILFVLLEAFEVLVLPRRIERPLRLTVVFYRLAWRLWVAISHRVSPEKRDNFLSVFGPLSLLLLLTFWAAGLIFAFATLHWSLHSQISSPEKIPHWSTYLYLSATTFITLGYGDVAPRSGLARVMTDVEAGVGFGFLAIVIGYLPVLYGAFSKREVEIALLDARASSPPSAGALLSRIGSCPDLGDLAEMLRDYERWAAELLESHLSYPVLMYYRSQHDRQSWLAALAAILDTCAFVIASLPDSKVAWQARMTFAMSRHASVDLALVFDIEPTPPDPDRLPSERLEELRALLEESGLSLKPAHEADERLTELRRLYEPYLHALSTQLQLALPSWMPNPDLPDNWQTSAWDRRDHFFQNVPEIALPPAPLRRREK